MGFALAELLWLGPFDHGDETKTARHSSADDEILAQLRAGEERAIEILFRRFADLLAAFAQRVGIDAADAEQVVVDVFHDVWQRRETVAPQGRLDAYLFRAVRNRALDVLRSGERRAKYEQHAMQGMLTEATDSIADDVTREEAVAAVWAVIDTLPEAQRTALFLRYTRELSIHEVARAMDVSAGAVKMLLQRAVRTLRVRVGGIFADL